MKCTDFQRREEPRQGNVSTFTAIIHVHVYCIMHVMNEFPKCESSFPTKKVNLLNVTIIYIKLVNRQPSCSGKNTFHFIGVKKIPRMNTNQTQLCLPQIAKTFI